MAQNCQWEEKKNNVMPPEYKIKPDMDKDGPNIEFVSPQKKPNDLAKMLGELPSKTIENLAIAVISLASDDFKVKIIADLFKTCPPEKVQEFMSICLNKSFNDAMPALVALINTQNFTEVKEETIRF